ncbi:MAG: hypothetical protein KBS51_01305 [Lachnospiraceae bacterium]|nr:hypothetical protein [Candidatus Darwinimomas equi]
MKELLTKNIGLKIASVIVAILVWMIVVNISNPEIKASKQVQIEVENDDVILNAGKTYELNGNTSVMVSYSVRTRDEYKIKASDFRAYVDMKDLFDITGSVPVKVEVLNNKDLILDASANPSVVRIKVEDVIKTTKEIEYELDGQPQDGYAVGSVILSPETISISGPASQVSQIKTVRIIIDADGISEDLKGTAIPLYVDASGRTIDIDDTDVTVNHTTVDYTLITLIGKSVPVEYQVGGSPAQGYSYVGVEGSIKEVVIRGSKAELAEVSSIVVPASVLDLGGTKTNKQVEVDLAQFVPGNLKIVGDSVSTVVMKVEGQQEKHFSINSTQIAVTNGVEGLEYLIEPITIGVILNGIQSDLDALDPKEILGSVDVTGMIEEGVYPVEIIFTLPAGYAVRSYTPVTVKVTGEPIEKETEEAAGEDEVIETDEIYEREEEAGTETESETENETETDHSGEN